MGGGAVLIVLPLLISGYLFNLVFYPLRYFSSRADGQKLFFMAAGAGLILGAIVFVATGVAMLRADFVASPLRVLAHAIDAVIPVPHACRLLLTVFASVFFGFFLNGILWLKYGRKGRPTAKRIYNKLTDSFGNPLAQLLRRAADRQKLVMINLKSRKIYCGRILEVPPSIESEDACIELLPSFSGYRDKDTLRMGMEKTDYPVIALWEARQYLYSRKELLKEFDRVFVAARFEEQRVVEVIAKERTSLLADIADAQSAIDQFGEPPDFDPHDWVKVIPLAEIESASFYDPSAYDAWFASRDSDQNSGGAVAAPAVI